MEFKELKDFINENYDKCNGKFVVTYTTGIKENKRLFVSSNNYICEFLPRSQSKGRIISTDNIESIKIKCNNSSEISCCRNNLRLVVKYLTASGLWKPMLNGAKLLQTLSDDVLLSMKEFDTYHKLAKELFNEETQWFGSECFHNLFSKKIKTMNFMSYDRDYQKRRLRESIEKKEKRTYRWRKGYDNSYEVNFFEDYARGWYSEEYKGTGNGWYYFLLDETHALFSEKD